MKKFIAFIASMALCSLFVKSQEILNSNNQKNRSVSLSNNFNQKKENHFTPNIGQVTDFNRKFCSDVLYKSNSNGAEIYLRKTGISYVFNNVNEIQNKIDKELESLETISANSCVGIKKSIKKGEILQHQILKTHRIDMEFENCNNDFVNYAEDEADGFLNFYYAQCPNGKTTIKQYDKIVYKNIYNNIDVAFYSNHENGMKYDLIVQPHADPNQIKLHWKGAEGIYINKNGNLEINTRINKLIESIPKVFQNINDEIIDIKTKYVLTRLSDGEAIITFSFSTYNSAYPLIIDPWVTYYGNTGGADWGNSVTTDGVGDVYMAGSTNSPIGMASLGFQNINGGAAFTSDAFLVKFNAAGNRLWATYYGGTGSDQGFGVITDGAGNVFIAGSTASATVIASGGFQNTYGGGCAFCYDAFLVKFNSSGVRIWGTYYGSAMNESANSVATDIVGNVYITGYTESTTNISTAGGFQPTIGGGTDAFLVKFDAAGNRLWATYYGGSLYDSGMCVATDGAGNAYMTGDTQSINGISSAGHQNITGGATDAFLVKFNPVGMRLWATYYGDTGNDEGRGVATDGIGNLYLAGRTTSANSIASGGFQNTMGGLRDGFLVKFNTTTGIRIWATYLGGSNDDYALSVAVDQATNHPYVSGDTYSKNFPVTICAVQQNHVGTENAFITHLYPDGSLYCSSYFGNKHEENAAIALFGCYLYLSGTSPGSLPVTPGAFQTAMSSGGGVDAYLGQFYKNSCSISEPVISLTSTQINNTSCIPCNASAKIKINTSCLGNESYSYTWSNGSISSNVKDTTSEITGLCPGNYTVTATSNCNQIQTATFVITGNGTGITPVITGSTTICSGSTTSLAASGGVTYSWSNGHSGQTVTGLSSGNYTVTVTDAGGCTATESVTVVSTPPLTAQYSKGTASCNGCSCKEWIMITASGGTNPYSYSWSNGYINRYINQLCPGAYTINIKDLKGCNVNINLSAP